VNPLIISPMLYVYSQLTGRPIVNNARYAEAMQQGGQTGFTVFKK